MSPTPTPTPPFPFPYTPASNAPMPPRSTEDLITDAMNEAGLSPFEGGPPRADFDALIDGAADGTSPWFWLAAAVVALVALYFAAHFVLEVATRCAAARRRSEREGLKAAFAALRDDAPVLVVGEPVTLPPPPPVIHGTTDGGDPR